MRIVLLANNNSFQLLVEYNIFGLYFKFLSFSYLIHNLIEAF